MGERSRAALAELEREAGLAPGILSKRFLPMFATEHPALSAIPDDDLDRLKAHLVAEAGGGPRRAVSQGAMLSPAEVQHFRALLKRVGMRIGGDDRLAPATVMVVRELCPVCGVEGPIAPDPVDVEAPPALHGTAGALRTEGGTGR